MTYEQVQEEVVTHLRELGIWYEFDERIAAAWLRHNLHKVTNSPTGPTIKLLDQLVTMRREGKEPPHKNGKYIS